MQTSSILTGYMNNPWIHKFIYIIMHTSLLIIIIYIYRVIPWYICIIQYKVYTEILTKLNSTKWCLLAVFLSQYYVNNLWKIIVQSLIFYGRSDYPTKLLPCTAKYLQRKCIIVSK